MGAWDYGIFDDDTAYEFEDAIKADAISFFKTSFEMVLQGYIDYTDAYAVIISAAYMDNLLNGTTYRNDTDDDDEGNVNNFGRLNGGLKVDMLIPSALKSLKAVIGKKSELNELWKENEELYPKWKANIEDLIIRLEKHNTKKGFWQSILNKI